MLVAAHFDANESMAAIGKKCGLREHTVRRSLQYLVESGVLRQTTIIDVHRLGLTDFGVYFSRTGETKRSREMLLKFLVGYPRTAWVADTGGDYQYGMSIVGRDISEMLRLLDEVSVKTGDKIFEKAFAVRVSFAIFPFKYLSAGSVKARHVALGGPIKTPSIDAIDRNLIGELVRNPLPGLRDISRRSAVPLSTLSARLEKLEAQGIVAGHHYAVNPAAYGYQTFRLLIFERGSSPAFRAELFRFAELHPNIVGFVHCFGNWDFELRVDVAEVRDIHTVVTALHEKFEHHLRQIRILTLLEMHKTNFMPLTPIGERARVARRRREKVLPTLTRELRRLGRQPGQLRHHGCGGDAPLFARSVPSGGTPPHEHRNRR